MQKVRHPNIIGLKEFVDTPTHYVLVMDLMSGGDLFDRLQDQPQFMEEDARKLITQVAEAIKYLHDHGIAHRDLKIENIMFTDKDSMNLKLGDFGLAKDMHGHTAVTRCGTTEYMAPEIVQGVEYSPSVDVWALGCLVFILLYGTFPFFNDEDPEGNRLVDITEKIKSGHFTFPPDGDEFQVSDLAKDLIRKALEVDASKRITVYQFLGHSWIKNRATNPLPLITPAALRTANGVVSMKDIMTVGVTLEREKFQDESQLANELAKSKTNVRLASISESDLLDKRRRKKKKAEPNEMEQ